MYRLLLASTLLVVVSWETSHAMVEECSQELPAIVKGYQAPSKLENAFLTLLRDKTTNTGSFRGAVEKLVPFLVDRVSECLEYNDTVIQTPVVDAYVGTQLANKIALVPVLRSGEALLAGFEKYFDQAPVWHVLVQRNEETAKARLIFSKVPAHIPEDRRENLRVIIPEPMIATGGSLTIVIEHLKERGVLEKNIIVASVVAAPEGLHRLAEQFPEICVTVLKIDDNLNEQFYIVPGLGDFGDRYYGTH